MMDDNLISAQEHARRMVIDLRAALQYADAVEALLILPLIADATLLKYQITNLIDARMKSAAIGDRERK